MNQLIEGKYTHKLIRINELTQKFDNHLKN